MLWSDHKAFEDEFARFQDTLSALRNCSRPLYANAFSDDPTFLQPMLLPFAYMQRSYGLANENLDFGLDKFKAGLAVHTILNDDYSLINGFETKPASHYLIGGDEHQDFAHLKSLMQALSVRMAWEADLLPRKLGLKRQLKQNAQIMGNVKDFDSIIPLTSSWSDRTTRWFYGVFVPQEMNKDVMSLSLSRSLAQCELVLPYLLES
ncbi:hypothetical protein KC726_00010 [Candidatus Woesebacteria bacterium]|nr:hypothetical protein [Candidatus Woesebacteria bacterium]